MGSTQDAIRNYVTAAASAGVDVASYVAPGTDWTATEALLGSRSSADLLEWFAFCGGVIPDSSTAYVFGGRPLLSAEQAASWFAPIELGGAVDSWVPLFDDLPATFVDPATGRVIEVDLVSGELVLAASLGEWIDAQRDLLAAVPQPGVIRFTPISFEPAELNPNRLAEYRISEAVEWLQDNPVSSIEIAHAPLGSKDGGRGLELEQAGVVRQALIDAGITVATSAVLIEDDQGSMGFHQITISAQS